MRHRAVAALLFLAFAGPLAAQVAAPPPAAARLDSAATLATGRKYTDWFYADMGDSLIAHSSAQVREKLTVAQLSDIQAQLAAQVGPEAELISEQVVAKDTLSIYLREVRFEMMQEPLVLTFTLGKTGLIYGFFIQPKSQTPAAKAE